MTNLSKELIKHLLGDSEFQIFIDFINEQILELDSLFGIEKMTNEQAGEECKVRLAAKKRLESILEPFINFQAKNELTSDQIRAAKSQYGL